MNSFETAVHDALNGGRIVIATRNAVRAPSPVSPLDAPGNLRLSLTGLSGEFLLRF